MSSTNFRSTFIFTSCVVGTCTILNGYLTRSLGTFKRGGGGRGQKKVEKRSDKMKVHDISLNGDPPNNVVAMDAGVDTEGGPQEQLRKKGTKKRKRFDTCALLCSACCTTLFFLLDASEMREVAVFVRK